MAKGAKSKKQSKLSPSKGQTKISSFFTKASTSSQQSNSSATTSPTTTVVLISDDEDCPSPVTPSRSTKRKIEEPSPTSSNISTDFVETTPVIEIKRKRPRRKAPRTPNSRSSMIDPDSKVPVYSPEHNVFMYVTKVLKMGNAFKVEPKKLFHEDGSGDSTRNHSLASAEQINPHDVSVVAEKQLNTKKVSGLFKASTSKQSELNENIMPIHKTTATTVPLIPKLHSKRKHSKADLEASPDLTPIEGPNSPSMTAHPIPNRLSKTEETSEASSSVGDGAERLTEVGPWSESGSSEAKLASLTAIGSESSTGCVDHLLNDLLLDDWDLEAAFNQAVDQEAVLDLESLTRCLVVKVSRVASTSDKVLLVKASRGEETARVMIKHAWADFALAPGDAVSVEAVRTEPTHWPGGEPMELCHWLVDSKAGLLVLLPDTLISTTAVVGSLFCARKAVLSAMFPGGDPANRAMLVGILGHEIMQAAMARGYRDVDAVLRLSDELLLSRQHVASMYAAQLAVDDVRQEVAAFAPNVAAFVRGQTRSNTWKGEVVSVSDIEENVWSPRLGLKGRIDMTARVREAGRCFEVALEIKTGRASNSAEHRGQVMLYQAMLNDIGVPSHAGLLLYLREGVVERVSANQPERAGLVQLRNRLAPFVARPTRRLIAPDDEFAPLALPEPISHHSACGNCPQLTLCSVFLKQNGLSQVAQDNPLLALLPVATEHLEARHVAYFLHWVGLILLEDSEKTGNAGNLADLWTTPASLRPRCRANLSVSSCSADGLCELIGREQTGGGVSEGDYVAVGTDQRPALYTGTVLNVANERVEISLDRPMTRSHRALALNVDAIASTNSAAFNLGFLRCLTEDSERACSLRRSVIDRQSPGFLNLPGSLLAAGKDVFPSLNIGQQAAVLKALSAKTFLLIKGMPGSGKTHTVAALVALLVATGKSVLLVSHTHSAVDTLLLKVMSRGVPVLRLGATSRVNPALRHRGEAALLGQCATPTELDAAFMLQRVVGSTCLGANHALLSRRRFDTCIVDESTQVVQTSVLRSLACADKFVLVGDPDQLAPVVRNRQARLLGMTESLFARLDGLGATVALDLQYRMNEPITELANRLTYRGTLRCANPQVAQASLNVITQVAHERWLSLPLSAQLAHAVVFLDTGRTNNAANGSAGAGQASTNGERGLDNVAEAAVVVRLVSALREAGIPGQAVGVMATYRAQVALLSRVLAAETAGEAGPEVNTVDQFQGRDKEVVVLSCTRSDASNHVYLDPAGEILGDHRRLTVAVTRAKHKLVVVGDAATLANFAPFDKLLRGLQPGQLVALRDGTDDFDWVSLTQKVQASS